jgi:hypothetical protein
MALSANKEFLAIYSQAEKEGRIIVMQSDRSTVHTSKDFGFKDAKAL